MYKLLIVDDEQEIRNGISNYFPWNEIGFYIVGQCENGKQALDFIEKFPVDVLLCDIKMPVLSGIDIARELYNRKSKIKIIFLSGYKDFEYAQSALKYKVKNYILKPTKYKELYNIFTEIKEELDNDALKIKMSKGSTYLQEDNVPSYNQKIINSIKNYVREHYKTATLEDVAQLVHMNPAYLSKFFKEKTKESFSDFVIFVKMEKAAELLNDISYKTYEISEMVGYSNAKNFTRMFKKYFNKTPRQYRNPDSLD